MDCFVIAILENKKMIDANFSIRYNLELNVKFSKN